MGTVWFAVLGLLVVAFQATALVTAEKPTCVSGFQSDALIIKVTRKHLRQGTRLGKVGFTDCTDRTRFVFSSDDSRFMVQTDGTLMVKRQVDLHEGYRDFFIHCWDAQGRKMTVPVRILYHRHHHENHHQNVEHHHGDHTHQHHLTEVVSENADDPQVPVLHFPKSGEGLTRRKREWILPDINILENDKGPFPKKVAQIRSSKQNAPGVKLIYSITGPGADLRPVGLFAMGRDTGLLYVTQPLDRERQAQYKFQAHVVQEGGGYAEDPMEIVVNVLDQNDNKPVFTKDPFQGQVPESSPTGFEVITVAATDSDDPSTDNAEIRYSILSQDPQLPSNSLFDINPVTGVIRVNDVGLDREKYPTYTLVVQASDLKGEGLHAQAKVILTVGPTNPEVPGLHFNILENDGGPFPKKIAHIHSSKQNAPGVKLIYSISGPGADLPPVGLFTMGRDTGDLYVTQPLDREMQAQYKFQAHAVDEGTGNAEEPVDIIVNVLDQNDNKPVFTKDPFLGQVSESSPTGFEVITVVATDSDDPTTDNAEIRYSILSQDPQLPSNSLFDINPVTGVIRVNDVGLDREKYPTYTLVVRAADLIGDGLHGEARVILTVTDGSDNAPVHDQPTNADDPQVPVLHFPKSGEGLKRRKREWIIPDINFLENDKGPFPKKITVIRSSKQNVPGVKIIYSISGPGADLAPVGLFTMGRDTGFLYVTQPLDREMQAQYKFQAHAVQEGGGYAEDPMEIVVNVLDQNDNKPVFTKNPFLGQVSESSPIGFEVITVVATDIDDPTTDNAEIRYRILSQDPQLPSNFLFDINPVTGGIRVNELGLDREKYPTYTLTVQAADLKGEGLHSEAKVILTVTDSNDNAPAYTEPSLTYTATVKENAVGAAVVKMTVTDGDEPHTPAWNAKFKIVGGDPGGFFNVTTGNNKQEGFITTVKGLDFETTSKHTLLVAVENEVPFAVPLPTATATVVVTVEDVNEPPVFDPIQKTVSKPEDLPVNSDVVLYTASDPDTARNQKIRYKIINDPAGWLNVSKDTGLIKVKNFMDRENDNVRDNKYTALIGAYDDDDVPATGTGTLIILLEDVNDNAPTVEQRQFKVCNKQPAPQFLTVKDEDGPGFAAPYSVSLQSPPPRNWSAQMNSNKTGIILTLIKELPPGSYLVVLRVADNQNMEQDNTIRAEVCDCSGEDVTCGDRTIGGTDLPVILGILGGILLLLMLLLLLLLFARRKRGVKKEPLLQDDDIRDNIYSYDEEGGGEDDQDYDLSVLHRGLDNRPDVFRNDVVPNFMPAPQYRPRPANPDEIGNFIDDNLKAADNDPTAPPYDSLLVFDYEGGGSDAGSLSSLNSSSSGDQDYDKLNEWGPRFKKLADMYGGGEDDML